MASTEIPSRQDIWLVAFGAGRAGEPGKTRPAVVVSIDDLSTGDPRGLIVLVPLSSSLAPSELRVDVEPAAGVERPSRAVCRAVRAVAASRLERRIGRVEAATMEQIETALTVILGFGRAAS